MKIHIHLTRDESGYYVAEVPSMPGCLSQGKTKKEALENIREAMEGWIEVMEAKRGFKKDLLTVNV